MGEVPRVPAAGRARLPIAILAAALIVLPAHLLLFSCALRSTGPQTVEAPATAAADRPLATILFTATTLGNAAPCG